jgi:hypothetical protein
MNTAGRDLVVGDLHGLRSLLERELERLGFDPSRDRLPIGSRQDDLPRQVTVHRFHVGIGQGVGQHSATRGGPRSPAVPACARFASGLVGVAAGLKAEVAATRVTDRGRSGTLALTTPSWA